MRSATKSVCVTLLLAAVMTGCEGREAGQQAADTTIRGADTLVREREVQDTTVTQRVVQDTQVREREVQDTAIVRAETTVQADTAIRERVVRDTTVTADTTVRADTVQKTRRPRP